MANENQTEKKAAKKPIWKRWWVWVLLVVVIGGLASSGGDETETKNTEKEDPPIKEKFLPVSKGEVITTYDPAPSLLGSEKTDTGSVIESYECKFHILETETLDGKLKRASLKFDIAEMKSNVTAGMAFAVSAAVFGDKVAGINLMQDKKAMKKLGLGNAYEPGPDEIENNGVILRRYTKGGKLFLEALPK